MRNIFKRLSVLALVVAYALSANGQVLYSQLGGSDDSNRQMLLSHNDYRQKVPFANAYAQGMNIIEGDLFMRGSKIVVCHDREEIPTAPLLKDLYLDPIAKLGSQADGLMLMFDLKEGEVMEPLMKLLKKYPNVFRRGGVDIIISGNRPSPDKFATYPDFVWFDGNLGQKYEPEALEKIWMFSDTIAKHADWNGKGSIGVEQKAALQKLIDEAHVLGKKVRFWATTDNVNTWLTLHDMGVDVIGTDTPAACAEFFSNFDRKDYTLPEPWSVYTPTYESDGKEGAVKNVIVIIGDGMGLAHMVAAETANRGELNLRGFKNIGLQRNPSNDYYNTCSSASATALFTGEKTDNNLLSVRRDGSNIRNTAEMLRDTDVRVGILSTGDITDATPAANYAHAYNRNDSELIAGQLPQSDLALLVGPNTRSFERRSDGRDVLEEMRGLGYDVTYTTDSIALLGDKVICIDDETFAGYLAPSQIGDYAVVMRDALKQLDNPNGFFMMFESARIDYASHVKNLPNVIIEAVALDQVIGEALKFADENGETLVIVTGDHETGGLALVGGDRETGRVSGYFVSDDHTGIMLPVYAYGVGSHEFKGFYENTEIIQKIMSLYGAQK